MSKIHFTISNESSDESIKDDLIRFKSYIDMLKSIQKKLEGCEVNGAQYGGLLILNNLVLCLESLCHAYEQNNYLAALSLDRHFIDLFMDVRVTTENLSDNSIYPSSKIAENLQTYGGLILWKKVKFYSKIINEKSLNNRKISDNEVIQSSKIMIDYYERIIEELYISDIIKIIENRSERRRPTYRNLIISESKKRTDFKELHYPWSKIEFERGAMIHHGEYNSLLFSGNSCVADKQNINYNSVLIKSQLTKLDALEYWMKAIYRALWPEIAWGKLFPRVKKNLKD